MRPPRGKGREVVPPRGEGREVVPPRGKGREVVPPRGKGREVVPRWSEKEKSRQEERERGMCVGGERESERARENESGLAATDTELNGAWQVPVLRRPSGVCPSVYTMRPFLPHLEGALSPMHSVALGCSGAPQCPGVGCGRVLQHEPAWHHARTHTHTHTHTHTLTQNQRRQR